MPDEWQEAYIDALNYCERLANGWYTGRDGFGFLIWRRGLSFEPMSLGEASIWHDLNFLQNLRIEKARQELEAQKAKA